MSYFEEPLSSFSDFYGRDSVDLLAQMIYSEASIESWTGKQGVAHVAKNRKARNSSEFGGGTYEGVLLLGNAFDGMQTTNALRPELNLSAWSDSLYIASNMNTQNNPIGTCLWFWGNSLYNSSVDTSLEYERVNLGTALRRVVEKIIIGTHTFFKVEGY